MENKRSIRSFLFGLTLICVINTLQISAQRVAPDDGWMLTNSYGVPVWIAYNVILHAPSGDRCEIFILVEPEHFTADNIKRLFTNLAMVYKDPQELDITAFSDKLMLQRAIDRRTSGVAICWANTPEAREAAKKWAEQYYPLPTGYYRANYFRIPRINYSQTYIEEQYYYSPDPAKPDMTTVVLQGNPGPPYTGDVNEDLEMAIREHDIQKVRSLLDKGADVNAKYEDGDTPLLVAVMTARNVEIVNLLLTKGADVNARNNENSTALMYAAGAAEDDIWQALLEKGADINHQDSSGHSALLAAAHSPHSLQCLKVLLARGAEVNVRDNDGNTPLISAAANCAAEMVKALLQKGASVNTRNNDGETALLLAARPGTSEETVRLLLQRGAWVEARNSTGETPLMLSNSKETILLLLSHGADVNARNNEESTALMYAVRRREVDKAQVLLEWGADVAAKNNRGETALAIAEQRYGNSNAMLDLLENAQAKHDKFGPNGIESGTGNTDATAQPQLVLKRDPNANCCDETSSVAFSPDGQLLGSKLYHSSFGGNNGIIFWDATSGRLIKSIEGPPNGAFSIAFSPDGRSVSSEDGKTWSIDKGKLIPQPDQVDGAPVDSAVYSAAFSPDGRIIASSGRRIGECNKITIRDATSGTVLRSFATDTKVTELRFSPDGRSLAGVIRDAKSTVVIWDATTGEAIRNIKTASPVFYQLAYSSDGRMLVASAQDGLNDSSVVAFDASTGKHIYNLEGYSSIVYSIAFSADGRLLATGDDDATVKLWDTTSGKLLRTMEGHKPPVRSVTFSPDGRLLASGGGKNETKIWSVSTGRLLVTLTAYNDGNWIAYTPDGYYDCSEGASKYITWRVGKDSYDEAKYRAQFFKPEIVSKRLR